MFKTWIENGVNLNRNIWCDMIYSYNEPNLYSTMKTGVELIEVSSLFLKNIWTIYMMIRRMDMFLSVKQHLKLLYSN